MAFDFAALVGEEQNEVSISVKGPMIQLLAATTSESDPDLSALAVARIHYELGEYNKATEYYNRIDGDSVYFADALYEVIWTFIEQEDYRAALEAVEIFLIAFPEHHYAARLSLLH